MIEVYWQIESSEADWVEAELKQMVLGYRCVFTDEDEASSTLGKSVTPPVVRQDLKIVFGRWGLLVYLHELEQFAADWRAYQSDACYSDEEGEVC